MKNMLRRLGQYPSWSIEAKLIRHLMGSAITSAVVEVIVCALLILNSGSAQAFHKKDGRI
ncbi:MAG: hypothetical protein ACLPPV_01145 [Candidatus Korobacteraceae bacterium]|jgi:hypothetical protein